jgi:hypothetical protein
VHPTFLAPVFVLNQVIQAYKLLYFNNLIYLFLKRRKNMKKLLIIAAILMFIPGLTFALDKPSSNDAKRVMDFYNNGKGLGAILVDYSMCQEMGKDEANKNDCAVLLNGNDIKIDDEIYLWMNFMIPVDDMASILITYTRNNRIRKTQEITLKSAFRYRTWKKIATDKPGKWTINISQELGQEDIDLGTLTYTVKE